MAVDNYKPEHREDKIAWPGESGTPNLNHGIKIFSEFR